jgi:phosphoglucosamine mutase
MDQLFGTDGIRGHAGEFPLDVPTVQTVGRALARLFTEKTGRAPRFVTGRDTRESGPGIENAIHAGAAAAGASVESAGVITTPGVAYLTKQFDFDAGIVISASHNPFHDNGIKIFLPSGQKMDEMSERIIEADVFEAVSPEVDAGVGLDDSRAGEFRQAYLEHLKAEADGLDLTGRKIVLDCANGAASGLAPELFASLGANAVSIHCEPDGRNINENCGSTHIGSLCEEVREQNADLGVAFDGDADRALFVDENGEVVDGDATLWIIANHLVGRGHPDEQYRPRDRVQVEKDRANSHECR